MTTELRNPSLEEICHHMMDITGAQNVAVQIRRDAKVLWINVNGVCALRICRIETLEVQDERQDGE